MQHVAREMNHSETTFVSPRADGFYLRWFTPLLEVALCGHATFASARILWETEYLEYKREVHFQARSGLLTVQQTQMEEAPLELDIPAEQSLKQADFHLGAADVRSSLLDMLSH